jgi:hypothetical protein
MNSRVDHVGNQAPRLGRAMRFCLLGMLITPLYGVFAVETCSAQTLVDLSSNVTIAKSGLVLNRVTNTFNSLVTVTNKQTSATLNSPLLLVISNIEPSTVKLANPSGQDPTSNPFIQLVVPANGLGPSASISNVLLEFSNPSRVNFTFAVTLNTVEIVPPPLPVDITAPAIGSIPPTIAVVDKPMQYQVVTSSANPTSLTFSLSSSPIGMTIDAQTGLMQWTPAANQIGDQAVNIVAIDSGGTTNQSFTVSVFGSRPLTSVAIHATTGGAIHIDNPSSTINGLSITIPAGALSKDTTLTISELVPPPTLGGLPRFLLKGFAVDPDGIALSSPAIVSLPYDTSEFGPNSGVPLEVFIQLYFLHDSIGNAEWLDGFSVDETNHILKGPVQHFSAFVATNGYELCPPTSNTANCPQMPDLVAPSWAVPTVLVHGFQVFGPASGRTSFAQLGPLLGTNGVHAWRFDWDTIAPSFEASAGQLATALKTVESQEKVPAVNLVAHSFGGILVRTYLQGAYGNDVNRTMTVGAPHQGIGGIFSVGFASICAAGASVIKYPLTCFESATGFSSFLSAASAGAFLRSLNSSGPLPVLLSPTTTIPNYDLITGQRVGCSAHENNVCTKIPEDGLITTAGNALCKTDPKVCSAATTVEETNPGVLNGHGLCHTTGLCDASVNTPMVQVNSVTHPLFSEICSFVNCFRLLGNWSGTATDTDANPGTINVVSASFTQSNSSLTGSIISTEPGDVAVPHTVTYTATRDGQVSFTGTGGGATITSTGNVKIDQNGLTMVASGSGTGEDIGSSGSGTVQISPDGLTMSVANLVVTETIGVTMVSETVTGSLTFTPDGLHLSGVVTISGGGTVTFKADKH